MIDPDKSLGDPRPRNFMLPSQEGIPRTTFAEQQFRPAYAFPSLAPFVDEESRRSGFPDPSLLGRVKGDWFVCQVSNALANACHQPKPSDAQASLDRAVSLRDAVALALAGIEAGIIETARRLNLPEPPFARKPEVTSGPRRLRKPVDPGQ